GLTFFTDFIHNKSRIFAAIIILVFAFIIIRTPFVVFGKEEKLDARLITIKQACNWLISKNVSPAQLFYSHPFTIINMDIDPYSGTSRELMYIPKDSFAHRIPSGNII